MTEKVNYLRQSRPNEYNFQSLGGGTENNKIPGQKRRKFSTWLSSCSVCYEGNRNKIIS